MNLAIVRETRFPPIQLGDAVINHPQHTVVSFADDSSNDDQASPLRSSLFLVLQSRQRVLLAEKSLSEAKSACNRSHTPPEPLASADALYAESMRLLLPFLDHRENPRLRKVRLIGIRAEKLVR